MKIVGKSWSRASLPLGMRSVSLRLLASSLAPFLEVFGGLCISIAFFFYYFFFFFFFFSYAYVLGALTRSGVCMMSCAACLAFLFCASRVWDTKGPRSSTPLFTGYWDQVIFLSSSTETRVVEIEILALHF